MSKNGTTKPKARNDLAEEWVGQEVFLYHPGSGAEVHVLNSGAALIWLLCDGRRELGAIASELTAGFAVPETQALADVEQAVEQFAELQLLEA